MWCGQFTHRRPRLLDEDNIMLTALRLGNFKAFADTQRIPIKPLTLIFGPNSAGKSSIVHSLVLAHQALTKGELDTRRTEIGGQSVDLGGFRQYVHRRDTGRKVECGFEIDVKKLQGRLAELLAPVRIISLSIQIGMEQIEKKQRRQVQNDRTGELGSIEIPTGELKAVGHPRVEVCEISGDDNLILRMSRRAEGTLQVDRIESAHPVIRNLLEALAAFSTTAHDLTPEDIESLRLAINELAPELAINIGGLLPSGLVKRQGWFFGETESAAPSSGILPTFFPISRGNRQDDLRRALQYYAPFNLNELIEGLSRVISTEILRLRYLGPFRSYPPRLLLMGQDHDQNWRAGGGYAWEVVLKDEPVRARVNKWLMDKDRLQTPYELVVRDLLSQNFLSKQLSERIEQNWVEGSIDMIRQYLQTPERFAGIERQMMDLYARVQSTESDTPVTEVQQILSQFFDWGKLGEDWVLQMTELSADGLRDLVLIDKRTSTPVSHRDVGIGISQVLPVLVAAYGTRNCIHAIEQPEIHLHPALQAELGDVFIESALGEAKNTFLLETHSEHLILRILRRIRETTRAKNDKTPAVRPEHVALLYVDASEPGSAIKELRVDEKGRLIDRCPGGFFEEDFAELF
jgi:predicted ATPase